VRIRREWLCDVVKSAIIGYNRAVRAAYIVKIKTAIDSFCLAQAYVVCTLGGAGTVTLSFLSLALLQAVAAVTLSMLLRHIKRYIVVGK